MPDTYPSSPIPNGIRISSISPTLRSVTHSGRMQTRTRVGHVWSFSVSYPPMTRANFAPLWAFLIDQDGGAEPFYFVCPEHDRQIGSGFSGSPTIVGNHAVGSTSISTESWNNSIDVLTAGDFVRIGAGGIKTHMVMADVASTTGGTATVTIKPPTMEAYTAGDVFWYRQTNGRRFTCVLASDLVGVDVDHCSRYGFSIDLVENFTP